MTTILIPAYEPDERLLNLIGQLKKMPDTRIVIVDDGSGEAYRPIFDAARAAGCIVLRHEVNRGKGRALKTGFRYLLDAGERGPVVCADSDGQHLPADIGRVAAAVREQGCSLVLGSRRFTGKVPLRSRFGNAVTRFVFAFTTGTKIYDTQTGLRGYSSGMLEWLCSVPGERFEYEMNLLLGAKRKGCTLAEVFIDTVYLDDNKSSHFRPLADSARIYLPILLFSASSILSAGIDFALLFLLQAFSKNLALSVAGARICKLHRQLCDEPQVRVCPRPRPSGQAERLFTAVFFAGSDRIAAEYGPDARISRPGPHPFDRGEAADRRFAVSVQLLGAAQVCVLTMVKCIFSFVLAVATG